MKYPASPKLRAANSLFLCFRRNPCTVASIYNMVKMGLKASISYIFLLEMIEFGKIFCDLHPNELVTNYCSRDECNVGLCATCICSHTETHIQRGSAPDYQNIRTTYSNMHDSLRARISALENQKTRINSLLDAIHNKKKLLQEVIIQARHETLDFVNRFFDAKERQILRKMEADEKKLGLHSENRMETLLNMISRDVNGLFSAAQELNSQDFLESFNRIRTQVLSNSLQTEKDISEELDKNQNYDVTATINPIYINEVKAGLEKCLNLCWDNKKHEVPPPNRSSRIIVPSNQNENSGTATLQPRHSESTPKSTFVYPCQVQPQQNQLHRCSSNKLEPYSPYPMKQSYSPSLQFQPPSFRYQGEPYIPNNSMPVQMQSRPNGGSRIEMRVNSSEKNVKENGRNPMYQSYMDSSAFNGNGRSQLDMSKKIRKSGLTVLRQVDNQTKN